MFYFGGMTLGYLESPQTRARSQDDGIEATSGKPAEPSEPGERAPTLREMIARARWFNLYW